ncbi:hypothetical protein RCZ04_00290 [Capnocytophaga sp. HP1101]
MAQQDEVSSSQWTIEFNGGVGRGELKGDNLELGGMISNGNWLVNYYPVERLRLQTGIAVSWFSNGSVTADNYYNTDAVFIGIPVKVLFSVAEIAPNKSAVVLGVGVQVNRVITYRLKTQQLNSSSHSGNVFLGVPIDVGVETKLSPKHTLGVYLSAQIVPKSSKTIFYKQTTY